MGSKGCLKGFEGFGGFVGLKGCLEGLKGALAVLGALVTGWQTMKSLALSRFADVEERS